MPGATQDPQTTLECWAGDWRAKIKAAAARDPALAWDLVGDLTTDRLEWEQREWNAWGASEHDAQPEDPVDRDFAETLDPDGLRFEPVRLLEQLVAARPRAAQAILKHLRGLDERGRLAGPGWRAEYETWRTIARRANRGRSGSRTRVRVAARPRAHRSPRSTRRTSAASAGDSDPHEPSGPGEPALLAGRAGA